MLLVTCTPAGQGRPRKENDVNKEDVQVALDKIRPALQADGGDVELVDVTDEGVVKVALQGACRGCPMSQMTLANGVERVLKDEVPGVLRVEAV
jgi:Fe-S cluster biogenesis protein NfuA